MKINQFLGQAMNFAEFLRKRLIADDWGLQGRSGGFHSRHMLEDGIEQEVRALAQAALVASRRMATLSRSEKDAALVRMAQRLEAEDCQQQILAANAEDLAAGATAGLTSALLDRLRLTPARLQGMAEGVRQIAALADPVGEELDCYAHPQGFTIRKIRVPIGVVGIIYESRPNVTIDCAALCLKSGNASILRGGKEAINSNRALARVIADALVDCQLPAAAVQLLRSTDRAALHHLIKADDCIHCLIPRGGEGLIRFVSENATMPVIKHYKGVCNIYLDASADPGMAVDIVVNAKCQRPSVCNAVENLLLHVDFMQRHWAWLAAALHTAGVELRVDSACAELLRATGIPFGMATESDYATEYLDKILSVAAVDNVAAAVDFIHSYGSGHSDAIVSADPQAAQQFLAAVDSATVYWNVSTRFTDGFEFGMGAEIGISTDKLHARGPMGLRELCSYKFRVEGNGQVRL